MSTDEIERQDAAANPAAAEPAGNASWLNPKSTPKLPPADLADWREAVEDVRGLAVRNGLSKSEVGRRSGVSTGAFVDWYNGKYQGDVPAVTRKLRQWLGYEDDQASKRLQAIEEPDYVATPSAEALWNALDYAQRAPAITIGTLGSGMGKTTVARRYVSMRPHAHRVVLNPSISTVHAVISEVGRVLNVKQANPRLIPSAVGDRIKRNGRHTLLILDEAQNLADRAFDAVRYWLDEYGCGLALLGNDEVYNRWGATEPKEGYGQLHRRIGLRVRHLKPQPGDVEMYVDAWGLEDPAAVKLLNVIGQKPGTLGQVAETVKMAALLASLHGRKPNAEDVKRAWTNRGGSL